LPRSDGLGEEFAEKAGGVYLWDPSTYGTLLRAKKLWGLELDLRGARSFWGLELDLRGARSLGRLELDLRMLEQVMIRLSPHCLQDGGGYSKTFEMLCTHAG
jgi:hypothetical protein